MNTLIIAVMSIALSVTAQFALKAGMSDEMIKEILAQPLTLHNAFTVLTHKFVLTGFMLYGLGAVVWLLVLSKWDVSKAYPIVGLGFVFTLLVGVIAGEQVTPSRIFGVLMISAGVLLVANS